MKRLANRLHRQGEDSGVVATEFVIIAPILIILVFGIIEFGFVFNAQISLTQAVREGVRVGAIGEDLSSAEMIARMTDSFNAVGGGTPSGVAVACPDTSATDEVATLTGTLPFESPISRFGPFDLTSTAVMRCGG